MNSRKIGSLEVLEVPGDPEIGTIILLHGFGADAYDLSSLHSLYPGPRWLFPQGPLEIVFSSHHTGRAWFPIDIELLNRALREHRADEISKAFPFDLTQASEAVEELIAALATPRSKLILGGFSQGAILATESALNAPTNCGGLVLFSTTLINEPLWHKRAPLHAHTPFFQSHGTDDPLLPLSKAQALEQLLTQAGLIGKLHTFKGGHEIPHPILLKCQTFLNQIFKLHK